MYVFVDKKTQAIRHIANVSPGDERDPAEFFPDYDPATMEVGRAPDGYVPVHFAIKKGIVVDLEPPPAETLAQACDRRKREINAQALTERAALAPDYQLLNAGLGVYDAERAMVLRATVNAFRSEVHRVEAAIDKAKSAKDVDGIVPKFPARLIDSAQALAAAAPAPKPAAVKKTK